ncbi:hypothetical protein BpHYR1_044262 [Brachionus plicatilis]|uniref:Uncharacterized protein n=1 Tax=Brachionus plicatilis TaxID=10195 RepID=A0A3M7SVC3_BRAPC|nr:hypothetical protein BpHYR1_044262 [Brachionus plicatilis]
MEYDLNEIILLVAQKHCNAIRFSEQLEFISVVVEIGKPGAYRRKPYNFHSYLEHKFKLHINFTEL